MSFDEQLSALVEAAKKQREHLATEEAVKTAVVLRLLQALQYNPFDPKEVVPEFTADVGIKKGEKVDYAICVDGQVSILIECKSPHLDLDIKHASQLFRYFAVTDARFAILTNGFQWQIFTDLDQPNKMDQRPFLQFDIERIDSALSMELGKFQKSKFNVDNILRTASDLKYISALKSQFLDELDTPSDELVSMLGKRVYDGRFTGAVHDQFKGLIKRSINEVIQSRVKDRIRSALDFSNDSGADEDEATESDVVTTPEEMDGFRTAVAIAAAVIDPDRIFMRDQKSYCGVLVDDNNRKPLVRLWFNSDTTKYLGLFDGEAEEKVRIDRVVDIYNFADRIRASAKKYA
ncbi:type I restriction endonuclease [Henriciella litoralis]|uniref:type I restriction endonuclease n=1 Tax=Henriciella litoralis TaxID=568102 RepID=UPI000A01D553|nr:type I restriction enzyme HsdR N-terminal domain-containing protein [Henriciella litoralis]